MLVEAIGGRPTAQALDRAGAHHPDLIITLEAELPSATVLDRALPDISDRYGRDTADLVASQLEYPWHEDAQAS
ncbi:hypothetical protein BH160DRAFT_1197 [Burkholderia sp. H160]|nr:hypothetical protein BH160DRAFT_1197 [Burkholderia sp. H160]